MLGPPVTPAPQTMAIHCATAKFASQYLGYALTLIKAPAQLPAPVQWHGDYQVWPPIRAIGCIDSLRQQFCELPELRRIGIDFDAADHIADGLLVLKCSNAAVE